MSGTKRYEDKSGEYYLQNSVKFQRNNLTLLNQKLNTKKNYTNFQNNKNLIKVNKNKLFDELVPIPKMKQKNKLKCDYEKKNLNNAVNNAKYIRRYQYSKNLTQKKIQQCEEIHNKEKIFLSKIKLIQIWWKTIFQIIKIQKNIKRFLYRKIFITILTKRKKYFEGVLNMIRTIKNIYWKKLLQTIVINKPGIKYFFNKWINITFKNIIVKRMIKNINMKIFNDNNNNSDLENQNLTSRSCKELNKQNNQIFLTKKKLKNNNQSLLGLHEYQTYNKNSSMSSLSLRIKKNRLSLGLEISTYKIFNPKNSNNIEVKQPQHVDNKLNKNNEKNKTEKKTLNNSSIIRNYKENKIIKLSKKENNNKDSKTVKSTLISNQNIKKKNNKDNRDNSKKKKIKKKKKSNKFFNINMNINNNYLNKLKDNNKLNKNKVYENELNLYNNKFQTLEINNNGNNFLNINKEWIDYSESNLDESQFNSLLDNSTMKDNQIINIDYNNNKLNKVDSNLIYVEINNDNIEKNNILKTYFKQWTKICILKKIIANKKINEGINIFWNIIDKQMYKVFFYKLEMINDIKFKEIFIDFIDNIKKKIFIKYMKLFRNKYCLYKYFNILKCYIQNKLIIEKIIQYQKDKIKRNNEEKNTKNDYPNYYYINDQYITNLPISNDFLKNKFNLNPNQANHCFIINNLNYNNNTNNIDIKLSYDDINNKTDNINNINITKIQSKVISFPKKKNKQNKPYIGLYKRNNNILQNIDNNFTDNIKQIFVKKNCNSNSSNINNIKKEKNNNSISINSFYNEINLNKSVALSKYQNQLNWDLMTKKNQLIMVINILERHRKIKVSKIYNHYFKIWKDKINNYKNSKILKNEDIYKSNIYEKKISFKKNIIKDEEINKTEINNINTDNSKQSIKSLVINSLESKLSSEQNTFYTYSFPDLSEIKIENIKKDKSIYKKKSISGPSNFIKKSPINSNNYDDYIIDNNEKKYLYGSMSPENYGFKKLDKIEEMEISFGNSYENKTNPVDKTKNIKYSNIKYIKPFITTEKKENDDKKYFKEKKGTNNIIIEEIEENNELDCDNINLIINLKSYFNEGNEYNEYNTINQFKLNDVYEIKKYKSMNDIL